MVKTDNKHHEKPSKFDRVCAAIAYFSLLAGAWGVFFLCFVYHGPGYQKNRAPWICREFVVHHCGQAAWTGIILGIIYFISGLSIDPLIINIVKGLYILAGIEALAGKYFRIPVAYELLNK